MMTREQYMLRKQEIDEQMKQTRTREKADTAALNEDYELRLRDLGNAYRRQRQKLFEERDARRLEIESQYKEQRRALWVEDCELVSQWRKQLISQPQQENENRSVGAQDNETLSTVARRILPPLLEEGSLTKEDVSHEQQRD